MEQKNSLNKNNKNIAIYDRDFKDDFITNINLAKKHNIIPAYSNQKFNYFLILHKKPPSEFIQTVATVVFRILLSF